MDASTLGGCPDQSPNKPRSSRSDADSHPAGGSAATGGVPGRAAVPPSLDPQETNVDLVETHDRGLRKDRLNGDVAFRHSGWDHDRKLIKAALHRCGTPDQRLERYEECGSRAWVVSASHDPSQVKIIANYCHDRFCRPCAAANSRKIGGNLADLIGKGTYRFITLTLQSDDENLADLFNKLVLSFRKLRESKLWKSKVVGGAAFTEIKFNQRLGRWHPHLHIICEGRYIDQQELSSKWFAITGDSMIVDIRRIQDATRAVRYVTKYASKPLSNTFLNLPDRLDEAICALRGRRLCTTFGTWRSLTLTGDSDNTLWIMVCPLSFLRNQYRLGNGAAIELLTVLGGKSSCKRTTGPRASPHAVKAISKLAYKSL